MRPRTQSRAVRVTTAGRWSRPLASAMIRRRRRLSAMHIGFVENKIWSRPTRSASAPPSLHGYQRCSASSRSAASRNVSSRVVARRPCLRRTAGIPGQTGNGKRRRVARRSHSSARVHARRASLLTTRDWSAPRRRTSSFPRTQSPARPPGGRSPRRRLDRADRQRRASAPPRERRSASGPALMSRIALWVRRRAVLSREARTALRA
jgi:hypothetical protein